MLVNGPHPRCFTPLKPAALNPALTATVPKSTASNPAPTAQVLQPTIPKPEAIDLAQQAFS